MQEFPTRFDDTLYENACRRERDSVDIIAPTFSVQREQVSRFICVDPGIGLGNERYRRAVGAAPVAASFTGQD